MTAEWKKKFRAGSFRGVPFHIRGHQKEGGRRVQENEFAQLDQSRAEDLGRKIGRFNLDLYVIDTDYFNKRDALDAALNKRGPGELVHPYLGRMTVQAGDYMLSETVEEGNIARFSVKFSEAGTVKFPSEFINSVANVGTQADLLVSASTSSFSEIFDILNAPAFVVQSAANAVNTVIDFMEDSVRKVTQPVANLTFALRNLRTSVNTLLATPDILAERLAGFFEDLQAEFELDKETATKVSKRFKKLEEEYEEYTGNSPSIKRQAANQQALIDLVKDLAFASQATTVAETSFGSTQEALMERDDLINSLDGRAEEVADRAIALEEAALISNTDSTSADELYQANRDLQAAVIQAVPQIGLSELIDYTTADITPAFLVAYELFGDIEKENEIIDQNGIDEPGFIPGDTKIEVSSG